MLFCVVVAGPSHQPLSQHLQTLALEVTSKLSGLAWLCLCQKHQHRTCMHYRASCRAFKVQCNLVQACLIRQAELMRCSGASVAPAEHPCARQLCLRVLSGGELSRTVVGARPPPSRPKAGYHTHRRLHFIHASYSLSHAQHKHCTVAHHAWQK